MKLKRERGTRKKYFSDLKPWNVLDWAEIVELNIFNKFDACQNKKK